MCLPNPPLLQECLQQGIEALNKTNNHCLKTQRDEKQKGVLDYQVRNLFCASLKGEVAAILRRGTTASDTSLLPVPTSRTEEITVRCCQRFCECIGDLSDRKGDVPCREGSPNPSQVAIPIASFWLPNTKQHFFLSK